MSGMETFVLTSTSSEIDGGIARAWLRGVYSEKGIHYLLNSPSRYME